MTEKATMDDVITKASIKERGWTDAAITRFLGEPDRTADNPHYKCAPPMKLYRVRRVEEAEGTPEFVAWKQKSEVRRHAAKAAAQVGVATKKAKLLEVVTKWKPSISKVPADMLRKEAIANYNEHHWDRSASVDSDPSFLARISVNYIRHVLTHYDGLMGSLWGQVGKEEAKALVRSQVYEAIADKYPDLSGECDAQVERRLTESYTDRAWAEALKSFGSR